MPTIEIVRRQASEHRAGWFSLHIDGWDTEYMNDPSQHYQRMLGRLISEGRSAEAPETIVDANDLAIEQSKYVLQRIADRLTAGKLFPGGMPFDPAVYKLTAQLPKKAKLRASSQEACRAFLDRGNFMIPIIDGRGNVVDKRAMTEDDRYSAKIGLGLESIVIEQAGEPAQVFKTPEGYSIKGWNANLPSEAFFEHSALLLTMLAVNLDIPLMFLLLDGSLVNFHGGRMTFDQAKLRFRILQNRHAHGLWYPAYHWRTRQRITPGSEQFDPQLYAAVKRGADPFKCKFRPAAWPYVKPLEDAAAEDLAERRNLKSMRSILADRGVDMDEHVPEVIKGRGLWIRKAIEEAKAIQKEHSDVVKPDDLPRLWREIWYGNEQSGVQLAISADSGGEGKPDQQPVKGQRHGSH